MYPQEWKKKSIEGINLYNSRLSQFNLQLVKTTELNLYWIDKKILLVACGSMLTFDSLNKVVKNGKILNHLYSPSTWFLLISNHYWLPIEDIFIYKVRKFFVYIEKYLMIDICQYLTIWLSLFLMTSYKNYTYLYTER